MSVTNNTFNDSGNPQALVSNVMNGPFGPTGWTLGNGLTTQNTYDNLGRLSGSYVTTASTNQVYGSYQMRQGAQLKYFCDTVINQCQHADYDQFNRLSATRTDAVYVHTWSYDRWGNRVSQTGSPSVSSSVDPATNRTMSFGYDVAGNLTNDAIHSYTYDAEGNLRQVDNTQTALYDYDAVGRRVKTATPSLTTEYLFDPFGHRISSWILDGTPVGTGREGRILWGDHLLATRDWDGSTFFHHADTLGTERARTDSAGNVATLSASEPFGDGFLQTSSDSQGAAQDNREFAQLDLDRESGTEHADFRQYSPAQGRWMSPDPYDGSYDLSNPQSMNRYAYVLNNPLSETDPTGMVGEGAIIGSIGVLGNVLGAVGFVYDVYRLVSLFTGPDLHRPTMRPQGTGTPNYEDPLNESLGYPKGGPQLGGGWGVAGALGIPVDQGCEFGACGFQQGDQNAGTWSNQTVYFNIPGWGGVQSQVPSYGPDYVHGWHYGNWCGAGGTGGTVNATDTACYHHDVCFNGLQITADAYRTGRLSGDQIRGAAGCNQQLCNAVIDANRSPGAPLSQRWAGAEIYLFFSLTGPRGSRCR